MEIETGERVTSYKMRRRNVTMQEIADRLHLSKSTVSRAFTRPELLDEETVKRVLGAASKLKFRPNLSAKALSSGKTSLIAILLPTLHFFKGDYLANILYGIGLELENVGRSMVIHSYEHEAGKEGGVFSKVLQRVDVEGALIFAKSFSNSQLQELASPPVPTVAVDAYADGVPSVYSDNFAIGCAMAEHVVGKGHRRIVVLRGSEDWKTAEMRARGACDFLKRHGLSVPEEWQLVCRFEEGFQRAEEQFAALLARTPASERPTAVVAANDDIASGVYQAMVRHGLSVPRDISVIGCDNNNFCDYLAPPLTSVEQNGKELGIQSVQMLTGAIPRAQLKCGHQLVVRESVGETD